MRFERVLVLVACVLIINMVSFGQTTYNWNVASGDWTAAASWNPARNTPAANDILVFDGSTQPTPTVTLAPRETIGRLRLINNVSVTISTSTSTSGAGTIARTSTAVTGTGTAFTSFFSVGDFLYTSTSSNLSEITAITDDTHLTTAESGTITAGTAYSRAPVITIAGNQPGLEVQAGSTLTLSPSTPTVVFLKTGSTGSILGNVVLSGIATRIIPVDAGALIFGSGSMITATGSFAGNAFGGIHLNAVQFSNGATYVSGAGSNPFGASAPNSVVTFQTGSLYKHQQTGQPSYSGRTFSNFEINAAGYNVSSTGASAFTVDNYTVTAGIQNFNLTGAMNFKGNISVASGATLTFTPASAATVTLNGSSSQTITNSGTLTFGTNSSVNLNNLSGLVLGSNITFGGSTLTLTNGNITTGTNRLVIGSNSTLSRTNGHVAGNLQKNVAVGSPSVTFDIGDATTYRPVTLAFTNVTKTGNVTASVSQVSGDHAQIATSGIDLARSVNRYWTLANDTASFDSYDATFNYVAGDVDGSADPNSFVVRKYNGSNWSSTTTGTRTVTSTQATGLTSFSDFAIGQLATPTISITGGPLVFGNVVLGTNSSEQTYTVSGSNLTTDISVTAPPLFQISTTSGAGFGSSITLTQSSGTVGSTTIYVRFSPISPGASSGSIVHVSTAADTQRVNVSGNGVQAGFLVSPSNISFGNLYVGRTRQDSTQVRNTGTDSLHITSATSDNNQFVVTPTSAHLAAGDSVRFQITFSPTGAASTSGNIVFTHNGSSTTDTVTVSGTGVLPPAPTITSITRTARAPLTNEPDTVSASITDSVGFASVRLVFAVNGVLDSVAMTSTGGSGYRGIVPGSANQNGNRIEYQIRATSNSGLSTLTAKSATNSYFAGISPIALSGIKAMNDTLFNLYKGYYARVAGVINGPNYQTSNLSQYVQDDSGGINLFKTGALAAVRSLGDSVVVLGKIDQFRGTTEIIPDDAAADIQTVGTGKQVTPISLSVSQFNATPEVFESRLVRFTGLLRKYSTPTWPGQPGNLTITMYQASQTDTVLLFNNAGVEAATAPEPTYPLQVTAIAVQFTNPSSRTLGPAEILSRYISDFVTVTTTTSLNKTAINLGNTTYLATKKDSVMVRNTGSAVLNISNASSNNSKFVVSPVTALVAVSDSAKFYVTFVSTDTGSVSGKVIFTHNGVSVKDTVSVSAYGQAGISSFDRKSITIGTIAVGTSKTDSVTMTNRGNFNLGVSTVVSSRPTVFSVSPMTTTLGVGSTQKFIITGTLDSAKTRTATLIFVHDGIGLADTVQVTLNSTTGVPSAGLIPESFELMQNYPNPFNPATTIEFALPHKEFVTLRVYNLLGQEVAALLSGDMPAGKHSVRWDGKNGSGQFVPSGVYVYRLRAGDFDQTRRMVLLK